jgi:multidrug efflux pump subunit AcrA (membrane-fusion protein)
VSDKPVSLFRREAVEHQRSRGLRAELLAIDSSATAWGFRLLCVGIVVALVFVILGRLNEYATGPAVVRLDGSTTLTASAAGLVSRVDVAPGDAVKKGQVLVRFHASGELSEYEAAAKEFDSQLGKLLLRPDDPAMREALVGLRTRRDLARTRLDQRTLVAPHDGIVGDVRVREGQVVEPGLRVLDLQEKASAANVVALMPGRYRPMLRPGDELRFTLDGFQHRAYRLVVSRVGDQIVGPAEAERYLGRDLADTLPIKGPVVLVQAALQRTSFDVDGEHYEFASGMFGKAEVVARNEPLAYAFIPSLKQWVDRVGGLFSRSERS